MSAHVIDLILVIIIWYLCSVAFKIFKKIDEYMAIVGLAESDFTDAAKYLELKDLLWKLIFNMVLLWIGANGVYFTLTPAIIGNGRTIGKLLAGIGVVDAKTLEEISPTRLIIRELIGRCIVETLFVIPWIISILFSFFRDDSKSLHDLIAKTIVIRLELYDLQD